MKIDWKVVARSKGYKSLKAAMIRDIQSASKEIQRGHRPMRDKAEFHKHFNWVIARAVHYAHHTKTTLDVVLNNWEAQRSMCWWYGYYQDSQMRKLNRKNPHVAPMKMSTYYKCNRRYGPRSKDKREATFREIMRVQKRNSLRKDKKARWSKREKDYQRKYGK